MPNADSAPWQDERKFYDEMTKQTKKKNWGGGRQPTDSGIFEAEWDLQDHVDKTEQEVWTLLWLRKKPQEQMIIL